MSETNVDKFEEPSIMSTDPKERILARRLRIQRRLDELKNADQEYEYIEEKTDTEIQIESSEELMQKLIAEGDEVISNVRIANDAREISRREEDYVIRQVLLKKLEEEVADSAIKYHEINAKWPELLESRDPLDIHSGIQSQKIKCDAVLAQKDVIIGELKKAIDNADNKFGEDHRKQNDDIDLLIDRIDGQINLIYKAYNRELVIIEDTLKTERSELLKNITKTWDSLYEELRNIELEGIERRKEIMREYEREMNRVLIEHQEQYRAKKIFFDTECHKLQLEVENMKALCLMNLEKLNYSYEILKRRQSENIIVKNQQKRRINKLQDVVNDLKKTFNDIEISTRVQIERMMIEGAKAKKNIDSLQAKSNHFTAINDQQFMQIWEMNTKSADKLLDEVNGKHLIFKVDKIVYEQVLGLEWEQPEEPLLKKEDLPSYREALDIIEKRSNLERENDMKLCKPQLQPKSPEQLSLEKKLLRHIMIQISDNAGFLIEDKLFTLLSHYTTEKQIIVKLNHVFHALNITSEEQIYSLINFFLPYSYCPTCTEAKDRAINELLEKSPDDKKLKSDESENEIICPCNSPMDERTARLKREVLKYIATQPKVNEELDNDDEESEDTKRPLNIDEVEDFTSNAATSNNLTCSKGHLLEIQSANVIKALGEFVEKYGDATRGEISQNLEEKFTDKKVILSRSISEKDMREYWRRYRDIFSSNKEKLWDALIIGLQKYHEILKQRHKLTDETDAIQKQNFELKRLLESCGLKVSTINN